MSQKLICAKACRDYFGVSDMTLWRWLHDPKLNFPKPVYISKRRYFRKSEVEDWVNIRKADGQVGTNGGPDQRAKVASISPEPTSFPIDRKPTRNDDMLDLRLRGETFKDIGKRFGITPETAAKAVHQAAFKRLLREARNDHKFPRQSYDIKTYSSIDEVPVSAMELSIRAQHCLEKSMYTNVGQIARASKAELLAIRNLGEASYHEIRQEISRIMNALEAGCTR